MRIHFKHLYRSRCKITTNILISQAIYTKSVHFLKKRTLNNKMSTIIHPSSLSDGCDLDLL